MVARRALVRSAKAGGSVFKLMAVAIAWEEDKHVPISAYTRMSTLSMGERTVSNVKLGIQIRDLKLETLANKIP
jgi:hypothetical protein